MASRYKRTFEFFDTEKQAKIFCDNENKNSYIKKNHKATYTKWENEDRRERAFIAWYVIK